MNFSSNISTGLGSEFCHSNSKPLIYFFFNHSLVEQLNNCRLCSHFLLRNINWVISAVDQAGFILTALRWDTFRTSGPIKALIQKREGGFSLMFLHVKVVESELVDFSQQLLLCSDPKITQHWETHGQNISPKLRLDGGTTSSPYTSSLVPCKPPSKY